MDVSPLGRSEQARTTVQPRQMGAIPVLLPILDALDLRARTNALLSSQAAIDRGQILGLLTLNRLQSPQPL